MDLWLAFNKLLELSSALLNHVLSILFESSYSQMIGVNTSRIIANVHNDLSFRYFSNIDLVRQSMGNSIFSTIIGSRSYQHLTVASAVNSRCPPPTFFNGSFNNLRPESFNIASFHRYNSIIVRTGSQRRRYERR